MTTDIPLIRSFEELSGTIEALYKKIENARERKRQEYIALGRPVPKRISFEELDLSQYMWEMLSVQKTLQWRGHNNRLGSLAPKARAVAIAGVCEFIKNEYMGRFWDSYQKLIGWGADQTVYNWLWQKGFLEEGIELIESSSGSRQFVQSLILESGIPKRRIGDILEFFVIYYRYLRNHKDIEELITRLAEGSLILPALSRGENARLADICNSASDYSRAFSLTVEKLNVVFDFIEKSSEIISKNIRDYTDLIHQKTGIHPLEILRDPEQLEKLYNRLLGFVTPSRLRRILAGLSPGTTIHRPSGKTISAAKYRSIQYGEHIIGASTFICVPAPALTPEKLADLPYDQLLEIEGGLLLKSSKKLKVTIGGYERFDVVHSLYTKTPTSPQWRGAVFYSEIPPAAELVIHDEAGRLLARRAPETGFLPSLSLGYFGNYEQNRHGLKVDIRRLRLHYPSLANERLLLATDSPEDKPLIFTPDAQGSALLEERYIRIRHPRPGPVTVKALRFDSRQEIIVGGKPAEGTLDLHPVMLFAPVQGWQIPPVRKGRSGGFGYKNLVLFLSRDVQQDSVETVNLKIIGECDCNEYRAFSLEWEERSRSSSIVVSSGGSEWYWRFDEYSDYMLDIIKTGERNFKGINFGEKEGRRVEDFALSLSPVPSPEIRGSLFWSIAVNDGMPVLVKFEAGPPGRFSGDEIRFEGEILKELLKPAVEGLLSGMLRVEISLGTSGHTFTSNRIWLFPDLEVERKELLKEGEPVEASVSYGSTRLSIILKDEKGSKEASLDLRREEGRWQLYQSEYSSLVHIEEVDIQWPLKYIPQVSGVKLGSHGGRTEMLRNMFRRELGNYDILIIPGKEEIPVISVNGRAVHIVCEGDPNTCVLYLDTLENIRRPKNLVKIETKLHVWSFEILHKLSVDHVKIHEILMGDAIVGEITFSGPGSSGLIFEAYEEREGGQEKRGSVELSSTGEESAEKRSFFIKLASPPLPGAKYQVKLFLLADIKNRQSAQEYGESWRVSGELRAEPDDIHAVISAAKFEMDRGRYFQARDLLSAIEARIPAAETPKVKEMVKRLEFLLCRRKIESVIRQASRVLKKEYALEEFKE